METSLPRFTIQWFGAFQLLFAILQIQVKIKVYFQIVVDTIYNNGPISVINVNCQILIDSLPGAASELLSEVFLLQGRLAIIFVRSNLIIVRGASLGDVFFGCICKNPESYYRLSLGLIDVLSSLSCPFSVSKRFFTPSTFANFRQKRLSFPLLGDVNRGDLYSRRIGAYKYITFELAAAFCLRVPFEYFEESISC